jgi:hypothetical protein
MIETLISSKTRIKLLLKFFLNSNTTAYLRSLETEFGESSNGIRVELNRLEEAGMLCSENIGNKKYFKANTSHPLYADVHNILLKQIGIDQIVDKVVTRMGSVSEIYLSGDFSKGRDSSIIDLIFVGDINSEYLLQLVQKVEKLIHRKIRFIIFKENETTELRQIKKEQQPLLLWATKN